MKRMYIEKNKVLPPKGFIYRAGPGDDPDELFKILSFGNISRHHEDAGPAWRSAKFRLHVGGAYKKWLDENQESGPSAPPTPSPCWMQRRNLAGRSHVIDESELVELMRRKCVLF